MYVWGTKKQLLFCGISHVSLLLHIKPEAINYVSHLLRETMVMFQTDDPGTTSGTYCLAIVTRNRKADDCQKKTLQQVGGCASSHN